MALAGRGQTHAVLFRCPPTCPGGPARSPGDAAAMARVLGDSGLRREMVTKGLAQAARFTWDRAARQLLGAIDVQLIA